MGVASFGLLDIIVAAGYTHYRAEWCVYLVERDLRFVGDNVLTVVVLDKKLFYLLFSLAILAYC